MLTVHRNLYIELVTAMWNDLVNENNTGEEQYSTKKVFFSLCYQARVFYTSIFIQVNLHYLIEGKTY